MTHAPQPKDDQSRGNALSHELALKAASGARDYIYCGTLVRAWAEFRSVSQSHQQCCAVAEPPHFASLRDDEASRTQAQGVGRPSRQHRRRQRLLCAAERATDVKQALTADHCDILDSKEPRAFTRRHAVCRILRNRIFIVFRKMQRSPLSQCCRQAAQVPTACFQCGQETHTVARRQQHCC